MAATPLRARLRAADSRLFWLLTAAVARVLVAMTRMARWHLRRGYALERLGHLDAAQEAYERAVDGTGGHRDWHRRLAELHEQREEWDAAASAYQRAMGVGAEERPHLLLPLARALQEAGRLDEAADALGRALEAKVGDPVALALELGAVHQRRAAWQEARNTYDRALVAAPEHPGLLEGLGIARLQLGDHAGAGTALETVLASADDPAPTVRHHLAVAHERVSQWGRARQLLEENLESHPTFAPSHRLLASVCHDIWRWAGYFHGSLDEPERAQFVPLSDDGGLSSDGVLEDDLSRACRAMERAVDLRPRRFAWRHVVGELREEAEYLPGAIEAYERAVEGARTSNGRWVFKSLHRWEYRLEHAHHAAGRPRVDDPLFTCRAKPVEAASPPAGRPTGLFTMRFRYAGLNIEGFVTDQDVRSVDILIDDVLLRSLNVGTEGPFPVFAFAVRRPVLDLFPQSSQVRVVTDDGRELVVAGGGTSVHVEIPHGDGSLLDALVAGRKVDKKGQVSPTSEETLARQERYLGLYEAVRDFFDEEIGTPAFLMYGTLLGWYRDGDFIPGDDDFDAGYVSEEADPVSVKEETKRIMLRLVRAGFNVSFNRRGRLFRVSHDDFGGEDVHLDLRPLWFEDGDLWVHNYVSYPSSVDEFLPVVEGELRGTRIYAPRLTEDFLRTHYGPGWKVPDPGFTYHPDEVDPAIMAHLERAFITPGEYRGLREELERSETPRVRTGRLVSVGSEPLYPLGDGNLL